MPRERRRPDRACVPPALAAWCAAKKGDADSGAVHGKTAVRRARDAVRRARCARAQAIDFKKQDLSLIHI
eukprot:420085-Prymnesium_polylepis.1